MRISINLSTVLGYTTLLIDRIRENSFKESVEEEIEPMKRIPMNRNMEGHKGGEVRRVHVLYFLSRNGAIEQPHLIRVHHLHRNGVYLRDVKRWLAELRGKDMPDSFAWSYKRRYKSVYVWQDLMDDELITPISDNEYVLKGSELSSKTDFALDMISSDEEAEQSPALGTSPKSLHIETDKSLSPKPLPEPDQESPGTLPPPPFSGSEMSDDSAKRASIIKTDLWKEEAKEEQHTSPKESSRTEHNNLHSPESSKLHSSSGRRTSHLFRNLFRCGWAETDNSALLTMQRQERYQAVSGGSYKRGKMADILQGEKPR